MHSPARDSEVESLQALRPLSEIARLIEVHIATISRWRSPGYLARDASRVSLRCVRFPGGWRTSIGAVNAFLAAVTADRAGPADPQSRPVASKTRERDLAHVDRELDAAGI